MLNPHLPQLRRPLAHVARAARRPPHPAREPARRLGSSRQPLRAPSPTSQSSLTLGRESSSARRPGWVPATPSRGLPPARSLARLLSTAAASHSGERLPRAPTASLLPHPHPVLHCPLRFSSTSAAAPTPPTSAPLTRIDFVTDIEGNLDYFAAWLSRCSAVRLERDVPGDPLRTGGLRLQLADHCAFVHGGDAFDKGSGDLRVARLLVDLKQRHPDRVFLLLGNRDVNKLRLAAELRPEELALHRQFHVPGPFFAPRQSVRHFYRLPETNSTIDLDMAGLLHYILAGTMGSPNAFEFRRQELAVLTGRPASDEDVVQSFVDGVCRSDGHYRQYLEHAQMAVVLGNTLFVHGALRPSSIRFVPSQNTRCAPGPPEGTRVPGESVGDWVARLNNYARLSLQDWLRWPQFNEQRTARGGEALMAYAHRLAMGEYTVMVQDFLRNDNLAFPEPEVTEFLLDSGISRVVTGHKPFGDCPAVIRQPDGIEIVMGDTSFSDYGAPDNRGCAVSVVSIVGAQGSPTSQVQVNGVLRDETEIRYALPPRANPSSSCASSADVSQPDLLPGDEYIGLPHPTDEGWWVRAREHGGPRYRLSRGGPKFRIDDRLEPL